MLYSLPLFGQVWLYPGVAQALFKFAPTYVSGEAVSFILRQRLGQIFVVFNLLSSSSVLKVIGQALSCGAIRLKRATRR